MPNEFEVELWRIVVPLPPPPKDVQARQLFENTPLIPQEQIEHDRRAEVAERERAKWPFRPEDDRRTVTRWGAAAPGAVEDEVTIEVRVLGELVELDEPDPATATLNRRAWNRIQERYHQPVALRLDQGQPVVTLGDGVPIPGQKVERYGSRPTERRCGAQSGDVLRDAVAVVLRRVPERWAEYDANALTATESQALLLLVAAGMVERRIRLRVRLHNHPIAVEATITATGEGGFAEAMRCVLASMWEDWKDACYAWQTGEAPGAPLSLAEDLGPDEWRLTDEGVQTQVDPDSDRRHVNPHLIQGPDGERISRREAVRGYGQLLAMRRVQADAVSPAAVNIGNWKEGAEALRQALEPLLTSSTEAGGAIRTSAAASATPASAITLTPSPPPPSVEDDSHLSSPKLAEVFGVPADALRTRLNRWRETHHDGWIENPERAPREPKYLYRVGAVRAVIEGMKATSETTSETTSERPAK